MTRLIHNLCVDIHRKRDRGANRVEDIEVYASSEEQGLVRSEDTPESGMETGEKRIVIRRAIAIPTLKSAISCKKCQNINKSPFSLLLACYTKREAIAQGSVSSARIFRAKKLD
ncbi:hypothetical protein [uncultured Nostoc sp.]|uniref:hypothetical protein n=1 Tax=uncultured Nostoc sp. TaxID=340711 RepID=UPI0026187A3E|nr:hypothetical protein [uncultured Nostoc sp.]